MHVNPLLDALFWEHVVARQSAARVMPLRGTAVLRRRA